MPPKTWVVLRGLARESGHWGPFQKQLEAQFPADQFLFLDLPGMGEFRHESTPGTMAGTLQFVRAKAIERASATSFRLLAISLGGMVAMEWLNQRPDEVEACALINTSSASVSPFYNRLRWQIWPQFLRLVGEANPRERERQIIDLLINSEEARAQALPLWTRIASEHPLRLPVVLQQLKAAATFKGLKQTPQVPLLFLNSLGDRLVDPSCSAELHARFGGRLERHPWAGHDLPWDDGPWVLRHLSQWLAN